MQQIISAIMAFILAFLQFFNGLVTRNNYINSIMSEMSVRDKVTQMMMVDFRYWDNDTSDNTGKKDFTVMNSQVQKIVEENNFGAIIYFAQNLVSTEQSLNLSLAFQNAATKNDGIPMIICTDQEGGSVYRLGSGTALPGNMALGATNDENNAYLAGKVIGSELSAISINTNLSPVVDVNNNANNPVIGLRSYSDDAQTVGKFASEVITGMKEYNVIGCTKHFPGHGDTATDSHYGLPIVNKTKEDLINCELLPYNIAINQGIEMIMTAHILYPELESDKIYSEKTKQYESLPATMSDDIITKLLKEEMHFGGIVVTDAMNMSAISSKWTQSQAVINAVNAGIDMICMPCSVHCIDDFKNLDNIINNVVNAVEEGIIKTERIDDAVKRILTIKYENNILNWSEDDYSAQNAKKIVGSAENRETERQIAAKAVTVIKNENNVLPLRVNKNCKVLCFVPYDNEKSQLIMGWNRAKENGLIPDGATIQTVKFSSSSSLSSFKNQIDTANVIIFNSEINKSSKMNGNSWESAFIREILNYTKDKDITTIVQSVDKPYDVQSYSDADAIIAVYGCKGSTIDPTEALVGGITSSEVAFGPNITAGMEVILGVFGASGKLPVSIPEFKNGSFTENILYNRGYGLTYDSLIS